MTSTLRTIRISFVGLVLLALLIASGTAGAQIRATVGASLTLSGPNEVYGLSQQRGMQLAVREINGGAVPGVRLNLKVIDDKGPAEGASSAFGVFARSDVSAVMGPTLSSVACVVDHFAQAARMPVIGISNTQNCVDSGTGETYDLTGIGSFVFRPALTERSYAPRVVKAVAESSRQPSTAGLIVGSSAFGRTSGDIYRAALAANNLRLTIEEELAPGATDYAEVATAIKNADPDIVVLTALPDEGVPLLIQLRAKGYNKPVIGSNAFNSRRVIRDAKAAANGLIVGAAWSANTKSNANTKFTRAFRARYKVAPDQFAAQAYAYTYVLARAIRAAGSASPSAVQPRLAASRRVPTVLGSFSFNARRDGVSPVVILEVQNQRYRGFRRR
jgi:branched-chain amino acid transport system substrate-binding protein